LTDVSVGAPWRYVSWQHGTVKRNTRTGAPMTTALTVHSACGGNAKTIKENKIAYYKRTLPKIRCFTDVDSTSPVLGM
jgi:hypothetical protein